MVKYGQCMSCKNMNKSCGDCNGINHLERVETITTYLRKINKDLAIRISVIASIVAYMIAFYPGYEGITNTTARLLSVVSSWYLGVVPAYFNDYVIFNFKEITPLKLSPECSGLTVVIIFIIVVWLIPNVRLKNRIYALVFVPILYFANIIRLLMAVIIGDKINVNALSIYHGTVGQLFIFVMLIACFMIFIKFQRSNIPQQMPTY